MRTTPMLKLTVAVLAVALAGTASAAGWRDLRIDASSAASYSESIATFQQKLTPSRRIAFARSLQDVWLRGSQLAEERQLEFTDADYFRVLHGLGYEEVVTLADPSGKKAGQYRAEYYASRGYGGGAPRTPAWASISYGIRSTDNVPYRGAPSLTGPQGPQGY